VGGLLGAIVGIEAAKWLLHWPASTGDGFIVSMGRETWRGLSGAQHLNRDTPC
jgi:hypothetical protein